MARGATVYKTDLQVADMDRHYYATHALVVACHPSEKLERMMQRMLAFAFHADENLAFTRGISSEDEPDIWRVDLSGQVEVWIELGQPDEKRIRQASGRADEVVLYLGQSQSSDIWWQKEAGRLKQYPNLSVFRFDNQAGEGLAELVSRTMSLSVTIQDDEAMVSDGSNMIKVTRERLKPSL